MIFCHDHTQELVQKCYFTSKIFALHALSREGHIAWFLKTHFSKSQAKIPLPFEQRDKGCVHSNTYIIKAKVLYLLIIKTCYRCSGGAMWAGDMKWQGLKNPCWPRLMTGTSMLPSSPGGGPSLSMWWCSGTWEGGDIQPQEKPVSPKQGGNKEQMGLSLLASPPTTALWSWQLHPVLGARGEHAAERVPPLPNPSSANAIPIWCLGVGVYGMQTLLQDCWKSALISPHFANRCVSRSPGAAEESHHHDPCTALAGPYGPCRWAGVWVWFAVKSIPGTVCRGAVERRRAVRPEVPFLCCKTLCGWRSSAAVWGCLPPTCIL